MFCWSATAALAGGAADVEISPAEVLARLKAKVEARDVDGTSLACKVAARIAGEPYLDGPMYATQDGPAGLTRREKLEFRLKVLDRLVAGIDKDNWRGETFSINVWAPGVPIAGMAPNEVKDPVVRKEYERRIAENIRKAEKNLRNDHLEYFKANWIRSTEYFVTRTYRTDPADVAEIKAAISSAVCEPSLRVELEKLLILKERQKP